MHRDGNLPHRLLIRFAQGRQDLGPVDSRLRPHQNAKPSKLAQREKGNKAHLLLKMAISLNQLLIPKVAKLHPTSIGNDAYLNELDCH